MPWPKEMRAFEKQRQLLLMSITFDGHAHVLQELQQITQQYEHALHNSQDPAASPAAKKQHIDEAAELAGAMVISAAKGALAAKSKGDQQVIQWSQHAVQQHVSQNS